MQERLDQTRAETAANRAVAEKARRVLEGLGSVEIPVAAAMEMGVGGVVKSEESAYHPGRTGTVVGDRRVGVDNGDGVDEEGKRYWEREGMGWAILDAEFA